MIVFMSCHAGVEDKGLFQIQLLKRPSLTDLLKGFVITKSKVIIKILLMSNDT